VAKAQGQFANPEERECLPLEDITSGLVKTWHMKRLGVNDSEFETI
jgi:hypothetical protein